MLASEWVRRLGDGSRVVLREACSRGRARRGRARARALARGSAARRWRRAARSRPSHPLEGGADGLEVDDAAEELGPARADEAKGRGRVDSEAPPLGRLGRDRRSDGRVVEARPEGGRVEPGEVGQAQEDLAPEAALVLALLRRKEEA